MLLKKNEMEEFTFFSVGVSLFSFHVDTVANWQHCKDINRLNRQYGQRFVETLQVSK